MAATLLGIHLQSNRHALLLVERVAEVPANGRENAKVPRPDGLLARQAPRLQHGAKLTDWRSSRAQTRREQPDMLTLVRGSGSVAPAERSCHVEEQRERLSYVTRVRG